MNLPVHYVVNFVIVKDNKVLLEQDLKIGWKLPGGHVEENEEPTDAVKREALEELNINVDFLSKRLFFLSESVRSLHVPFETFVHQVEKDRSLNIPHKNVGLVYLVTTNEEPTNSESQNIKWFTKDELEQGEIHEAVKSICLKAFSLIENKF